MIPYWRPDSTDSTLFLVKYRHWQATRHTSKTWHKHKRYVKAVDAYAQWTIEEVKHGR